MSHSADNRIVMITRHTRLQELVRRYNTVAQAKFYIERLGGDFSDYEAEDETYRWATQRTEQLLREAGRLHTVDRAFLPNYVFGRQDLVVVLGQDGLVANTVKYLDGQAVIGVNPDPARWEGRLLPYEVEDLPEVLCGVFHNYQPTRTVTLAEARLNDGQTMLAVNDLFIGPKTHTTALYTIATKDQSESQCSSGVVISTGVGSSGWYRSLMTGASAVHQQRFGNRQRRRHEPEIEFPWESHELRYTVREPFPTHTTSVNLIHGRITRRHTLKIRSSMPEHGVIFSDGIEADFLQFNSGAEVEIILSQKKGCLVV